MSTPPGPPPSYAAATAPRHEKSAATHTGEERRLPPGWVRRTDKQSGRDYYIDTTVDPPRSIWHHPLDDDEYLDSLVPADDRAYDDEEYDDHHRGQQSHSPYPDELPPRDQARAGPSNFNSNNSGNSSNSGFSGWAKRFGNGMEDNFRYRHGLQPRATAMNDPNGSMYDTGYNSRPDVVVVGGRGRYGRGVYMNDGYGYGYVGGRRRRGGLISTAIGAAIQK